MRHILKQRDSHDTDQETGADIQLKYSYLGQGFMRKMNNLR